MEENNFEDVKLKAKQGDAEAQNDLGGMYDEGQGVTQDYKEAVKWWRRAAEQGYAKAQTHLGYMYQHGDGVIKDYKEAVKWYRLAAEQGNAAAQTNLGNMYHNGDGVIYDRVSAHMWHNLAASNALSTIGYERAKENRDDVAEEMTPSQLEESTRLAREFEENYGWF